MSILWPLWASIVNGWGRKKTEWTMTAFLSDNLDTKSFQQFPMALGVFGKQVLCGNILCNYLDE